MPRTLAIHHADDWDDYLDDADRRSLSRPGAAKSLKRSKSPLLERSADPKNEEAGSEGDFNPSFSGSRHERQWILTYLAPFHQDQLIVDVLRQVKGGKEATVYCCAAHPSTGMELIAAKVYRPKMFRSFKNDAEYKWGRPLVDSDGKAMRDSRILKAVARGSRAGEAASHASWLAHEFSTMRLLDNAGADVPRAIAHDDNAMLMSYFGTEHEPAPTLSEVRIPRDEAPAHFERLMRNVELMLRHDRIHGDLSAYNVLYWEGEVTIIDFPQVINAYGNPNAFNFLLRDVERLCQYFARYGVVGHAERITNGMWQRTMPDESYEVRGSRGGW